MLTFKKDAVHQYFSEILEKTQKEPVGITDGTKITNVIIAYDIYKNFLDAHVRSIIEKNIEDYFKLEKHDEDLNESEMIN